MNWVADNPRPEAGPNEHFTDGDRKKLDATHSEIIELRATVNTWTKAHDEKHQEIDRRLLAHSGDIKTLTGWQDRWRGIITVAGIVSFAGAVIILLIKFVEMK